jgi:hypothetical protein
VSAHSCRSALSSTFARYRLFPCPLGTQNQSIWKIGIHSRASKRVLLFTAVLPCSQTSADWCYSEHGHLGMPCVLFRTLHSPQRLGWRTLSSPAMLQPRVNELHAKSYLAAYMSGLCSTAQAHVVNEQVRREMPCSTTSVA